MSYLRGGLRGGCADSAMCLANTNATYWDSGLCSAAARRSSAAFSSGVTRTPTPTFVTSFFGPATRNTVDDVNAVNYNNVNAGRQQEAA